jgi:O-antigen/teichoic acid export membrane protein
VTETQPRPAPAGAVDRLSAAVLSGTLVAVNALAYVFTVLAARALSPAAFGELAALLGVLLIGTVPANGLQTYAALRLGSGREPAAAAARGVHTAGVLLTAGVVVAGVLASVPLAALLHLAGPGGVLLLTVQLAAYTLVGGYSGTVQGAGRYGRLALVTVLFGVTRLVGGLTGLLAGGTPDTTLAGLAAGAVLGAAVTWAVTGRPGLDRWRGAPVVPALRASAALLGLVVLSNADLLLARHLLPSAAAGDYAVGGIVFKVVFWLPQGVAMVLLPRLGDPAGRARALPRALALVGGLGAASTIGVAVLGGQTMRLVGGPAYGAHLSGVVWLFAALGTLLGVAQLLLYSAIAARAAAPVTAVWIAVAVEVAAIAVLSAAGGPTVARIVGCATAAAALLVGAGLLRLRTELRAGPQVGPR